MSSSFETSSSIQSQIKEFKWYNSQSLPLELQCGITRLELSDSVDIQRSHWENLTVSCSIVCSQTTQHDPPVTSLFSQPDIERNHVVWEQLVHFPIKVRDLLLDALITFTVFSPEGKVVGGSTMRLFDDAGCLKQGRQKLLFYFDQRADPTVIVSENQTVGELYELFSKCDQEFQLERYYERYRLTNCVENGKYDPRNEWLDRLLLKRIEVSRGGNALTEHLTGTTSFLTQRLRDEYFGRPLEELEMKNFSYLIIDMPTLSFPVSPSSKTEVCFTDFLIFFSNIGFVRRKTVSLRGPACATHQPSICAQPLH